jgi:UDP-glucuronate 4-epimerase
MVYASSSSVYGGSSALPFSESDPVNIPVSLYAASKQADELMGNVYAHLYRIPMTGLRFFTVYGPWGRPDMAAFIFTRAIFMGEPIKIFNNGDRVSRDLYPKNCYSPNNFSNWSIFNKNSNKLFKQDND